MTKDEEIKLTHSIKLLSSSYADLCEAIWDVLGESSYAISRTIGKDGLAEFETDHQLKVDGQPLEVLLKDIAKIFHEEFGFMKDIQVEVQGDKKVVIKVDDCNCRGLCDKVVATGVKKPFGCGIMCTYAAALERSGLQMRNEMEKWTEKNGTIITFTNVKG